MKKNIFNIKTLAALLMAGAAFTACSNKDEIIGEQSVNPVTKYTMTVNATKGDGTTRALSLSGKTLSAKWAATDQVSVFPEAWSSTTTLTPIGTLTAAASATGSTSLAGEVETPNLNTGDNVQMLFPRATWDYTGQKGVLLAEDDADNAIETKYDYALATPSITVSGTNEITANAAFESQQAIVKFNLQDAGGSAINATSLKIYANGGQLVQSRGMKKTYTPAGWEPVSGENKYYVYIETNWAIEMSHARVDGYDGNFYREFKLDGDYGTNGCQVVGGKYVYRFVFTKEYGDAPTQIKSIMLNSADHSHMIEFAEYDGDTPIAFTDGMYLRQYDTDSNPGTADKVQKVDVKEGTPVMASTYGALTVTPESAASELTVALRNELGADTYSFLVNADNGKTYTTSKSNVNFENGKYYEITMKMTEAPQYVDLSTKEADYEAQDGDVLTGQLPSNYQLTIAADATVTLFNATVNYGGSGSPAVSCLGNATLVLKGTNTVTCNGYSGAGITPADGSTLTIQGNGILNVNGNGDECIGIGYRSWVNGTGNVVINSGTIVIKANSAAIGAKYGRIGDIEINGGNVTAYGNDYAAAIGCGYESTCGNITITGGTVTAIGNGAGCTAIGTGGGNSTCGDITISGGTVKATAGNYVDSVIGVGESSGTCSSVTITTGITSLTMTSGKDYAGIVSDFIKATAVYANTTPITTYLSTSVTDAMVTTGMTAAGFATSYDEGTKTWTVTK